VKVRSPDLTTVPLGFQVRARRSISGKSFLRSGAKDGASVANSPRIEPSGSSVLDPVDAVGVLVEGVVARLGPDVEQDQDADGQTDGQPGDVEKGKTLRLDDVPPSGDDVVLEHGASPDKDSAKRPRPLSRYTRRSGRMLPVRAKKARPEPDTVRPLSDIRPIAAPSGHVSGTRSSPWHISGR